MIFVVVLDDRSDATELLSRVSPIQSFQNLPRHYIIDASSLESLAYELAGIPCKISADEHLPACNQPLTINGDLDSCNWGLARTIRRRAPWRTDIITRPIETFYDCVRDGGGVDVYVLDTGIRIAHDEFGGRASIIYEYVTAGAD